MSTTRSRKEHKLYKRYLKTTDKSVCNFCAIQTGSDQLIEQTEYFKVLQNIFPYSIWDGLSVVDHLMITPIQHTDNLGGMQPDQKTEFVDLVARYEAHGYNIYARTPASKIKSVAHQHTHLIKTEGKPKRLIFLLLKPYFRIPG